MKPCNTRVTFKTRDHNILWLYPISLHQAEQIQILTLPIHNYILLELDLLFKRGATLTILDNRDMNYNYISKYEYIFLTIIPTFT